MMEQQKEIHRVSCAPCDICRCVDEVWVRKECKESYYCRPKRCENEKWKCGEGRRSECRCKCTGAVYPLEFLERWDH